MTTIAWDGKTLAADRRVSFGGVSDSQVTKIVKRKKDGALCGTSGNTAMGAAFKEWFLKGEKGPRPPLEVEKEDMSALIIKPSGKVVLHDKFGSYEILPGKNAIGSGWMIALGAMAMGAFADKAVQVAAQFDGATGNEIDTLRLGK